ncbi:putative FAD-dependent dehydrogenase [Myroides gitamensis]|nr:putative FAD-dependent dehydrogenase [Myroides gitamensis]
MPQELLLQVLPEVAASADLLTSYVAQHIKSSVSDIQHITILKRSIDARQRIVKINLKVQVFFTGEEVVHRHIDFPAYKNVKDAKRVIVVGAGPAGYFAALQLIELGVKTHCNRKRKRRSWASKRLKSNQH